MSRQQPGQASPSDLLQLHPDSSLFCPGAALAEITQLLPCAEGRGELSVPRSSWVVDLLPLSLMVWSCSGQDAGVFPQTIFPLLWLKLQGVHPKSGVYLLFFNYFFSSAGNLWLPDQGLEKKGAK